MTTACFDFISTDIKDLVVVQRKVMEDHRGFLSRFYCEEEFRAAGLNKPIVQINQTMTRKQGAVRGLHFQRPPFSEIKLVSCLKGEILDVAVDLRRDSPTFLQWHSEILSAANRKSLLIPEGFAHGFQALSKDCELIYLHTASYHREAEGALNIADPSIAIGWPLEITDISERDLAHPLINAHFEGIVL